MEQYKKDFIEFLVATGALKFGEFTLKSGRLSPYFFTTGNFNSGQTIARLGYFYAAKIREEADNFDIIFGPAYKGIPLAVATALALAKDFNIDKGYLFDRKEAKEYADKSAFVGHEPQGQEKILLIDDVMTTGKTKEEAMEKIHQSFPKAGVTGLIIALNRQEKDAQGRNAMQEFTQKYAVPVKSIISIGEALAYLHNRDINGTVYINDEIKKKIENYLDEYGI